MSGKISIRVEQGGVRLKDVCIKERGELIFIAWNYHQAITSKVSFTFESDISRLMFWSEEIDGNATEVFIDSMPRGTWVHFTGQNSPNGGSLVLVKIHQETFWMFSDE